jgi:folate-dependent phosphoribosylglycinamide formyltransferase PurN
MLNGCRKSRRYAIFISGGGSTLQSFLDQQHQFEVKLVISNKKTAHGVLRAKRNGICVEFLNSTTRLEDLNKILKQYNITHIFLAGYMKILSAEFIHSWQGKISNIHPSLLPKYKGLNAAEKSWQEKSDMGVSLHDVIADLDSGALLMQKISSKANQAFTLNEALLFLRTTEQSLLRKFSMRFAL